MNVLNKVLKFILLLVLAILLVITQLLVVTFILTLLQELIIPNKDYLILANNSFYQYVVFFIVVTTFIIFIAIQKKTKVKIFSEEFDLISNLICNKIFLIGFGVISLIIFILTIFNHDVVYKNELISYSLFNTKGTVYKFEDIKEVNVSIKKYWNGSMNAKYVLVFENHETDILGSVINVKNEKDTYDNNLLIDQKIKQLNIKKNIQDKSLKKYNQTLDKKYQNKINILFDKITD